MLTEERLLYAKAGSGGDMTNLVLDYIDLTDMVRPSSAI